MPPFGRFKQVAAGNYHTSGLRTSGVLVCWGRNDSGQTHPVTVSGHTTAPGVVVHYSDNGAHELTTDGSGNYSFKVSYEWSGIVSPSLDACADATLGPTFLRQELASLLPALQLPTLIERHL